MGMKIYSHRQKWRRKKKIKEYGEDNKEGETHSLCHSLNHLFMTYMLTETGPGIRILSGIVIRVLHLGQRMWLDNDDVWILLVIKSLSISQIVTGLAFIALFSVYTFFFIRDRFIRGMSLRFVKILRTKQENAQAEIQF